MSETSEHRGWEISSDYHEHWQDDPEWDIAEDEREGSVKPFIVSLVLLAVFGAAVYLAGKWLEPPPVTFTIAPAIEKRVYVPVETIDPKTPSDYPGRVTWQNVPSLYCTSN